VLSGLTYKAGLLDNKHALICFYVLSPRRRCANCLLLVLLGFAGSVARLMPSEV
jgi:hypothetical protein